MAHVCAYLDSSGITRYLGKGNADRAIVTKPKNKRFAKWLTIDGHTIFPSRKAMIAAIGQSKSGGACSASFKYV